MSHRTLFLVLLLALLAPLAARAETPRFSAEARPLVQSLEQFDASYDWEFLEAEVLAHRQQALPTVRELVAAAQALRDSDPLDSQVYGVYANFVARVLRGQPEEPALTQALQAADLLLEEAFWDGTPLAAQPKTPDAETLLQEVAILLEPVRGLVGMGNLRLSFDMLNAARARLHLVAWGGVRLAPEQMEQLNDIGFALLALQVAQGVADPVLSRGERLVRQAVAYGWAERELTARLALVEAGRLACLPEVVERHLAAVPGLAERLGRPEARFIAESVRFEQDLLRSEGLPWSEVARRHREAWAALPETDPGPTRGTLDVLLWRWVGQAARIWVRELRSREVGVGPEAAEAQALLKADQERLRMLAAGGSGPQPYREGLLLQWGNLHMDLVEEARRRGDLAEANRLWTALAGFGEFPEDLRQVDRDAQPGLDEMFPGQNRRMTDGEFLRLVTRYHQEGVRLLLAGRPDRLTDEEQDRLLNHVAHMQAALEAMDRGEAGFLDVPVDMAEAALFLLEHPQPKLQELRDNLQRNLPETLAVLLPLLEEFGDRPNLAWMLYQDARFKLAAGDRAGAVAGLRRAVDLVERRLTAAGASQAGARRVRQQARPLYELLARVLLEEGKAQESFEVLGRLQQVESRGTVEQLVTRGRPGGELLAEAGDLQARTESLEAQVAMLPQSGEGSAALGQVRQLLASTQQQYWKVVKQIEATLPDISRLSIKPFEFSRVQSRIPADTTVVQFFPSEKELFLFVLSRHDLKVRTVAISRRDLEGLVLDSLANLMRNSQQERARGDWSHPAVADLRTSMTELYDVLVAPVEEDLGKRPVVAFIPTGVLTYVPFAALARQAEDGRLEFLVETRRPVTLLKAVDLMQLASDPARRDRGLVAVGNPDGSLQFSAEEVEDLRKLFPGAKVAKGPEATRNRIKQLCSVQPSYVHLATHGTLTGSDPMRSYLTFSDGPLDMEEIAGFEMGSPSLVTLSACQTALGKADGSDLTTLAETFAFAGDMTTSLVASLWSVSDESTRVLIVEFYRQLAAGRSKAEALQAAQLHLLRGGKYSSPYHWAPFVLIGDWR